MKKIVMTLMAAGLIAAPSLASAETTPYVSVSAGLGLMHDSDVDLESGYFLSGGTLSDGVEYKTGYAIEGAIGAQMDMFRGEFAVGYQSSEADKIFGSDDVDVDVSVLSFMANGYADFEMNDGVSPYVMAGVGIANCDVSGKSSSDDYSDDSTVFAWQVGAGVGVKAADDITVDLGYRYFATADIDLDVSGYDDMSFATSKILLGMRYSF